MSVRKVSALTALTYVAFVFGLGLLATGQRASADTVTVGVNDFDQQGYGGATNIAGIYVAYGSSSEHGVGETLAVPAGHPVLDSFSIIADSFNAGISGLDAQVIQWSDATESPVGSALFSSAPAVVGPGDGAFLLNFQTGGVQLNPADEYLLEFTIDTTQGENDVAQIVGEHENPTYTDGGLVIYVVGTSPPTGYYPQAGQDLYFQADFSSVPEPTSLSLLAVGGVALLRRPRRHRREMRLA